MSSDRMSAAVKPRVLSVRHQNVASRFSFGVNERLVADIGRSRNAEAWLERQMAWSRLSDSRGNAVPGWFPRLQDSPSNAWSRVESGERSGWDYGFDLAAYTMARRVVSRRQVQEVMTDFWSNLFHIPTGEDRSFPWRYSYDAAIRKRSLTSFRSLLRTVIVHPAMSGWLNNNSNTKRGINENLGRELLELYTVGRTAGYDEDDVKNSARILTGYKVEVFDGYAASYNRADHYVGRISVLGFRHDNSSTDGRDAVAAYLDYLARHPATAERIATRLCVRFVSDKPSASIVNAVTKSYLRHDTDIKAVLRTLVAHPDFAASRGTKLRTPIEDVINAARVLGMRPTGNKRDSAFARQIVWMGSSVGQYPFSWPRPDGFPEAAAVWSSPARLLRSWSIHHDFAGAWWGPTSVSTISKKSSLPTRWPRTLGDLTDHQSRMLLGRGATADMRAAVATMTAMSQKKSFASESAVSSWTWTLLRAAVLNSPEGMLR